MIQPERKWRRRPWWRLRAANDVRSPMRSSLMTYSRFSSSARGIEESFARFCKTELRRDSDAATSPGRRIVEVLLHTGQRPLLMQASVAPPWKGASGPALAFQGGDVGRFVQVDQLHFHTRLRLTSAGSRWRHTRGPTFSVHPLVANEWVRIGIRDEELTDRAESVSPARRAGSSRAGLRVRKSVP